MTPGTLPHCPHGVSDRFICNGMIAAASTVSGLRAEFAEWLRPGPAMDDTRLCDVVLAVNEALANAAEFAYAEGESGTLDVEAVRDVGRRTITVTVSDRGRWRETDLLHRHPSRGRGIPLMRTLADSMIISTSGLGTSVCLRFDEVRSEGPLPAGSC